MELEISTDKNIPESDSDAPTTVASSVSGTAADSVFTHMADGNNKVYLFVFIVLIFYS